MNIEQNRCKRLDLLSHGLKFGRRFSFVPTLMGILMLTPPIAKGENGVLNYVSQKTIEVSGIIKDAAGNVLPGVSVTIKGKTGTGTITDQNGRYILSVEPGQTFIFKSIGFLTQEVQNVTDNKLDITLQNDTQGLEEVVVVGFGTQKKESLVGSQSTIKPAELKLPVRDLTNAIAGRLAGVVAYQRGGAPGADGADIFIRGIATLGSSPRSPLLVVDGVPDRSINNIDPEDVESFTVLKDASATAVYGTRGANGVIIINTKKGKIGKPQINAEVNQAINKFTELPKFLDGPTFMQLYNEGLTMRGRTALYTDERINLHKDGTDPDLYPNVDWYKELFKEYGQNRRATLNANGGSENASYYLSAGYFGETGMFKQDEVQSFNSVLKLDRFNFTSNLNLKLTPTTKLDFGANGYITNYNEPNYGVNTIFAIATQAPPHTMPTRYSNGQWPQLQGSIPSPYMFLTQSGVRTIFTNVLRSNIKAEQALDFVTEGLRVSTMFAFDVNSNSTTSRGRTPQTYFATGRDDAGELLTQIAYEGTNDLNFGISRFSDRRIYTETAINYARKFGDHDVSGLFLFNQSDFSDAQSRVDDIGYKAAIPYRQRNFVGRATYGYSNRYFLEGNFSYSGSDAFVPSKRFGFFPSGGLGWIVSNESFFEPIKSVVSHFKLRYTYGLSGNAALNDPNYRFLYLSTLGNGSSYTFGDIGSTIGYTGYKETLIGGDVKWETSYRQNLGVEMNFLNKDLELIVELFKERRENILTPSTYIPFNSGFLYENLPWGNVGRTKNKGIDISLNYTKNFAVKNFISFRGSFNYNQNEVVEDGNARWKYPYLDRIGRPIGQRFGYIATGLFQSQDEVDNAATQAGDTRAGDIRYKDLDGNGIINGDDQTAIGYGAVPRIVYGLNIGAGVSGFDIALFFQGAGQVDFNYASGYATTPFSQGPTWGNMYEQVLDRWTPENPNPRPFYPRLSTNQDLTTNYQTSTWWIQRADYIRLKSAELGYTFDGGFMKKWSIQKIRLYTNGTNLWTLSKWKFWDPELGDGRGASYPNITTYNVGLRINFK
ncbi:MULTISPECIES: TonB-dependent receptor [unclassified Sphingobacterium]|uniref:SusC/RagA family TonB-linked outer membrane protein n=1 Tax=unclassified Sphingobacterium TaxID=2609468 RepID=UPI001051CAEA|nr:MULTISPECIES: TonB-dependent receptor [unclassified Sphingobacterium]MCS3554210.1 TonB-linked SusC/RagA family outer membrane protein [Sphingobacterium sp. JUb21]TCR08043.1 TonB-linked SusC/RagA family outer membrane protein [Sphingobacterium sp. JUb20]